MATKKTVSRKTSPAVAVAQFGEASLAEIVAATNAGSFVMTSPAVHNPLIEAGLVEINPEITNEAGEIATRAIIKPTETETQTAMTEEQPTQTSFAFELESNVPMPSIVGRGRTSTTYPFEQMEVGQSFFVANTEAKPNAAKSMASTVSSATARFAVPKVPAETKANKAGEQVPVMVNTRQFVVRSVEGGARVWRTV